VPFELGAEGSELLLDAGLELVVVGGELGELDDVLGAALQVPPDRQLFAQPIGLAQDALSPSGVVPEVGPGGLSFELFEGRRLGVEVKGAPRSWRCARPGPGRRWCPSALTPQALEQDRSKFDDPLGGLAPCDHGVHAGTVGIVRADAAVPVAAQPGRVTAGPAVPLAGDEIDERIFDGIMLHSAPPTITALGGNTNAGRVTPGVFYEVYGGHGRTSRGASKFLALQCAVTR
jgi:hypothetical protein